MRDKKNRNDPVFVLHGSNIFLEEVFELLFGEHGLDDLEDRGLIFFVQLVDQVNLFKPWLTFHSHFLWQFAFKVYDLIHGHAEELGELLKLFHRWFADAVFQFVVVGIANAQFGGHLLLQHSLLFAYFLDRVAQLHSPMS